MPIFRAVLQSRQVDGQEQRRHPGIRLPSNVPYLVDNLWESARPAHLPSRRHAIYASPTPELALAYAVAGGAGADYVACRVEFLYPPAIMQLTTEDAKLHPDLLSLQQCVNKLLGAKKDDPVASKLALAPLFLPGVSRTELAAAMTVDPFLADVVTQALAKVTVWSPPAGAVSLDGEMFFEVAEDNTYQLFRV